MKPYPDLRSSAAVHIVVKLILIALFLGCLADMPYIYFQIVRFSAMIGFCYLALQAGTRNNNLVVFTYFALAILFQPTFKIALGRFVWNLVDVIVAIGLLLSIFLVTKKQSTVEA